MTDREPAGVVAHRVALAQGISEPFVVVLTSGEQVPGPIKACRISWQLNGKVKRTESSLEVEMGTGRMIFVNDIADVTLATGGRIPTQSNSGVGTEYWK